MPKVVKGSNITNTVVTCTFMWNLTLLAVVHRMNIQLTFKAPSRRIRMQMGTRGTYIHIRLTYELVVPIIVCTS
jgi:hypothetical protein